MTEPLDLTVSAGEPPVRCELAIPPGDGRTPALIVVHEWWGLNDDIRAQTERFAGTGFLALAVDLYAGRSTSDAAQAMELSTVMKTADAMRVVAAAAARLREHPRCNGKVGITGFCLGGAMSIAAACTVDGIDAAVPFYGIPRDEFSDFARTTTPISAHYGTRDPIVSSTRAEGLATRAAEAGRRFDLHLYDAGHAFMRAADPSCYDAAAATLAWDRAVAFLRETLA
ncbi:MAG: dienelactone hydrolase family protein [Deltaproteobacteria bacterium]|nr:dienelactone hydrolase family protein [Deltaproteobacteria bacterium]